MYESSVDSRFTLLLPCRKASGSSRFLRPSRTCCCFEIQRNSHSHVSALWQKPRQADTRAAGRPLACSNGAAGTRIHAEEGPGSKRRIVESIFTGEEPQFLLTVILRANSVTRPDSVCCCSKHRRWIQDSHAFKTFLNCVTVQRILKRVVCSLNNAPLPCVFRLFIGIFERETAQLTQFNLQDFSKDLCFCF